MSKLNKRKALKRDDLNLTLSKEVVHAIRVREMMVQQYRISIQALENETKAVILRETGIDTDAEHVELDLETGEITRA